MVKEMSELNVKSQGVDEIPIDAFDHVEFFVGNALQAAYYYHKGFGFDIVAFKGLETGERSLTSYVLKQGKVQIVLTSALNADSAIAKHVLEHGDGVKSIAFRVKDAKAAYEKAISRGAFDIAAPHTQKDDYGTYTTASVGTYGDTIHTFIERENYKGIFAPGYQSYERKSSGVGLIHIDHIVGNVEVSKMEYWVDYYKKIFGFYVYQYFDAEDISTKYSSLVSKVMANKSGIIKMPINEPALGIRKSQIQEYLDYYSAGGVQHIAISTGDIIKTVGMLRERGVEFLTVPQTYYDTLTDRVGKIDEDLDQLAKLGILVDRESDGYLLQIFTKPVEDRPTLFFEIIQRKGAQGFGKGNFKALFESIEEAQAKRGNL